MHEKLFPWFICLLTFHWHICSYSAAGPKHTACLWQEEISTEIPLHSALKLLGSFHRKVIKHRKLLWCNLSVLMSRKMYSLILFLLCQNQKETSFLPQQTQVLVSHYLIKAEAAAVLRTKYKEIRDTSQRGEWKFSAWTLWLCFESYAVTIPP